MAITDPAISTVSIELPRPPLEPPFPWLPDDRPAPAGDSIGEPPLAKLPPQRDPVMPIDPATEPPDDEPPHVEPVPDDN